MFEILTFFYFNVQKLFSNYEIRARIYVALPEKRVGSPFPMSFSNLNTIILINKNTYMGLSRLCVCGEGGNRARSQLWFTSRRF